MKSHGHVTPNKDGSRARCGGPGICEVCSREAALAESAREVLCDAGDIVMIEAVESGQKWMAEVVRTTRERRPYVRWIRRVRDAMALSRPRTLRPGKERIVRKCAPFEAHEFRRMAGHLTRSEA